MTIYGFHKLTSTLKSMEGISSDERYFEGLLTVQMKDKQGEVTIVDELYKVLPVWIDRGAPISDTHSNRIVGKGINYSRTTVKNGEGHELPAIKITGKIFKNYELDNVIWNKIKNNEYKGLSFGGATRSARSPIKMKDGSTAYALSDLEHYEVAVCADPAVPMAIITDFNQIAKANFNSSVRDDGKMVIQCDKMGCYVNKTGGGDLLTVMEGDKPENYNEVEAGKQRGRAIDKTEPTGLTARQLKLWKEIQEDDKEDSDNQYYNKFMEKKEMLDATLGNKEEKRPTQPESDMRETETSGYTPDLEKAIEIINKAGYRVDTEDRNNGTEINDTKREIPEKKLPIKGSLSQELPTQIQQADLNESQTFEQKVQALMAEGKSRESAEKIVGSFVHKVEASSGSGGAGIGGANMTNGGTLTTQTGGANNPIHNNKCQCDKCRSKGLEKAKGDYCPNCGKHKKLGVADNGRDMGDMTSMGGACPNCGHGFKDPRKPKAADISNTGSGGTTEGAFNQDAPNAQRLNNKADDVDLDKIIEEETENIKGKKGGGGHRSLATRLTSGQNAKKKADDEEDEEVAAPQEVEEERPEWDWLMNRHKSKAIREVNKVHALLKLNKVRVKACKNCGLKARGMRNEGDTLPVYRSRKTRKQDKVVRDAYSNMRFEDGFEDGSNYENKDSEGKKPRSLPKHDKDPNFYSDSSVEIDGRSSPKPPRDRDDRDDNNDPPTPKIRYSRGGDTAARQLKMSLDELNKKKAMTYRKTRGNVEMKYPTVGEEVWDSKQQKRVKETKTPKRTMALEKALYELKKLQISGGLGSRGLGSDHGHTQGSGDSTQVTLVQPRPEDDRVQSKRTTQEPKVVKKIRANRGVGAFGSDLPDGSKNEAPVADENTRYIDHNGKAWKTQAEADAVPARKRMNRRLARDRRNAYRADTRQTIGDRLKE